MGSSFLAAAARRWMSGLSVATEEWQTMHFAGCGMATVEPSPRGSWQALQPIFPVWTGSLWLKGEGCAGATAEALGFAADGAGLPASCAWPVTVKPDSMTNININSRKLY